MNDTANGNVNFAADNFYEYNRDENDTFLFKQHEHNSYHAHFHAAMEVYYILEGEIEAVVNEETFLVKKGDILVINPFEVHEYKQISKAYVAVFIFSEKYLSDFNELYKNQKLKNHLTDKIKNQSIYDVLKDIKPSFYNNTALSVLGKKGYVNLFLEKIVKGYGTVSKYDSGSNITEILKFIYNNYNDKITLDTLAKKFNYSKTSISRMLSKYLHTDIRCFINNLRAEQADILLKNQKFSSQTIIQIAYSCGFDSPATFYRAYKRRFGTLPRR